MIYVSIVGFRSGKVGFVGMEFGAKGLQMESSETKSGINVLQKGKHWNDWRANRFCKRSRWSSKKD
jgi:hypothetical protein